MERIIEFSAHHRWLVLTLTAFLLILGVHSLKNIPIDALPDLSDTQVILQSRWERSPDIIENQVTYPIVSALLGTPKVKAVRGFSDFGFSYVYVIFEDGTDLYWARSRVLEQMSRLAGQLPQEVKTEIGPDASSVGWVYQYALVDESGRFNSADLRSLQDWWLRYQIQGIPGISQVASIGGFVKQYQVRVDPTKLELFQVTLSQVMDAVGKSNQESGARNIEISGREILVRSRGLVNQIEDIENSVIEYKPRSRAPILIKQVATVSIGPDMRRGLTDLDGTGDTVGAIAIMRQGEDAQKVIEKVKKRLSELQQSLPDGVKIVETYDRSALIQRAIRTLKSMVTQELIIVALIIFLFLWHPPSAFVPIVTIPTAVVLSFIPLYFLGQTSNIMSLAGIAISIGVLVDGAIIEVENAYRKTQIWLSEGRKEDYFQIRLDALKEVGPSVFLSLLVVSVSFLPIFTLVDQEGRLFRPLALSKTITMIVAALLALTLDPALRMILARVDPFPGRGLINKIKNLFLVGRYHSELSHPITGRLVRLYEPLLNWSLSHSRIVLGLASFLVLTTVPVFLMLGSEFMPPLREGSLLYMPTALPGLSVTEAQRILTKQGKIIKSFPEVASVFGKAGRAETSTDTAPLSMIETTIVLRDPSEWRKQERFFSSWPEVLKSPLIRFWPETISEEQLVREMDEKLRFPGMPNIWTMPIRNRVDMLSTGIRSPVGIKIFGSNLNQIQDYAERIEGHLKNYPGVRTVVAERAASGTFLDLNFDREKLKIYGLTLQDAQDQAMTAIGGRNVSEILAGRERYPIQVRFAPVFRQTEEAIRRVLVSTPSGAQIPLREIATPKLTDGPSMIRNENASLVGYVYVDLEPSSDIKAFVEKAQEWLNRRLPRPEGIFVTWSGQYENMARVLDRLKYVIPLTLLILVLLIHLNTGSLVKTSIIFLAIPFSMVGAFWLLWCLDYHLSAATWVGLIALMGLDAETGIFMLMYLDLAHKEHNQRGQLNDLKDLRAAVVEGAAHRLRPKLMTVITLFAGLLPIMWSLGTGSEVMKRIAAPMVGGLATSFLLELLIYPVVFFLWKARQLKSS